MLNKQNVAALALPDERRFLISAHSFSRLVESISGEQASVRARERERAEADVEKEAEAIDPTSIIATVIERDREIERSEQQYVCNEKTNERTIERAN